MYTINIINKKWEVFFYTLLLIRIQLCLATSKVDCKVINTTRQPAFSSSAVRHHIQEWLA